MTTTASQAVKPNTKPRRSGTSRKPTSTPPTAHDQLDAPTQTKLATRLQVKASEQRPSASPKATPPSERMAGTQPSPPTKQSLLIALLERKRGATLDELTHATGWQAHSVRGVMSGVLRKRLGLNVQGELFDGVRHYRITTAA